MPLLSAIRRSGCSSKSIVVEPSLPTDDWRSAAGDIFMRRFFERFWRQQLGRFWHETDAATAVEYAVMLALILVAVMSAIGAVASQAGGMWGSTKNSLDAAGFGS